MAERLLNFQKVSTKHLAKNNASSFGGDDENFSYSEDSDVDEDVDV